MTSMNIIYFPRPPTPFFIYVQNSSTPSSLDVQFQVNPASPSDNQSTKRKHNPRMTFICYQVIRPFLQVGFRFQYQLINLAWLSFFCLAFLLSSFHSVCERKKIKTKTNEVTSYWSWPRYVLFPLSHKQCNDTIKRWLHCLTSEWHGRFLVSNISIFGSIWCMATVQIQFSLIIKKRLDFQNTC